MGYPAGVLDSSIRGARAPVVVIVGGGASGTLTAIHLLRRLHACRSPLRLVLVDRYGRHGRGQAYSTADPRHLLNTRAAQMSALADDSGHLLRWCHAQDLRVAPTDYLPRGLYGRYLSDLLADTERRVRSIAHVSHLTATATALTLGPRHRLRVHLAAGGRLDAEAVVLATGIATDPPWTRQVVGRRCIPEPWRPDALAAVRDGTPVLVVGTGLTMIDVATSVTDAHPDTIVYAVSRHGLVPHAHQDPPATPIPITLPTGETTLSELLRAIRAPIRENDGDWQGIVDALRPHIPRLWTMLDVDDQQRFLSRLARYWEIHRHRIPPATARHMSALRATGRLRIIRGRLASVNAHPDGITARIAGENPMELNAGWLVNGTGPSTDITQDAFYRSLFAAGLARPDPFALGLDADGRGRVIDASGRPNEQIFTLGPTLRGRHYETTAVPEIRAQAADLATHLIETFSMRPSSCERPDQMADSNQVFEIRHRTGTPPPAISAYGFR